MPISRLKKEFWGREIEATRYSISVQWMTETQLRLAVVGLQYAKRLCEVAGLGEQWEECRPQIIAHTVNQYAPLSDEEAA